MPAALGIPVDDSGQRIHCRKKSTRAADGMQDADHPPPLPTRASFSVSPQTYPLRSTSTHRMFAYRYIRRIAPGGILQMSLNPLPACGLVWAKSGRARKIALDWMSSRCSVVGRSMSIESCNSGSLRVDVPLPMLLHASGGVARWIAA